MTDTPIPTQREIKRRYDKGEIGLSDAKMQLVLYHCMTFGGALKYLGL